MRFAQPWPFVGAKPKTKPFAEHKLLIDILVSIHVDIYDSVTISDKYVIISD